MFDVNQFQTHRAGHFGAEFHFFEDVESTNILAEKLARVGCVEGTVVFAESQSGGKGRNGAAWYSPPEVNLYFTVVLRPSTQILKFLPYLSSLAFILALEKLSVHAEMKWPNDILVGNRKIGGVMVQTSMEGNRLAYALAGCGLNVNLKSFPNELKMNATSIALELARDIPREPLLASILHEMENLYERIPDTTWESFCELLEARSTFLRECEVRLVLSDRTIEGVTCGLDSLGGLVLRTNGQKQTFYSGEIELCRKK